MTQWKVGCGESSSVVEVKLITAIMSTCQFPPICSSSRVSYRYHLAHCTYNHELEQKQTLYISQPESHQVLLSETSDSSCRF